MNTKRILSVILAAALLVMLLAACGQPAKDPTTDTDVPQQTPNGEAPTSDTDVKAPETTLTPDAHLKTLSICGIPVVKDGGLTGLGYQGATYADGVLTLENADIVLDMGANVTIMFTGDLEIVLVGENSITASNGLSAIVGGSEEPDYPSSLKISGDGSLSVSAEGENTSALMCTGPIDVASTGTLELTGGAHAISGEGGEVNYAEGVGVIESTETHMIIGKTA